MSVGETLGIRRKDGSGPVIALRPPFSRDLNDLRVDPEALRYMTPKDQRRIQWPQHFLDELGPDKDNILWGVFLEDDGPGQRQIIGIASIGPEGASRQEIGLLLVAPGSRGRGIGPMVTAALVDYCFKPSTEFRKQADSVYARPRVDNKPAQRALASLGFTGSGALLAPEGDANPSGYREIYRNPQCAVQASLAGNLSGLRERVEQRAAISCTTYQEFRDRLVIEPIPLVLARQ